MNTMHVKLATTMYNIAYWKIVDPRLQLTPSYNTLCNYVQN